MLRPGFMRTVLVQIKSSVLKNYKKFDELLHCNSHILLARQCFHVQNVEMIKSH